MIRWNRVIDFTTVAFFSSALFSITYWFLTGDSEFELWELLACVIVSGFFTVMFVNEGFLDFFGVILVDGDGFDSSLQIYTIWVFAVVLSIFNGISDGSTVWSMIAIGSIGGFLLGIFDEIRKDVEA
tara:strand:+ start:2735 stop:3115 length:381 start_codon:yes stop_codon:yes gene_type:complete